MYKELLKRSSHKGEVMKILIMLLFLSLQSIIAQNTQVDSVVLDSAIIYTEIYDEVEEWVYENKGTIITRELKKIRYILFDIYITVYYPKNFMPLEIKTDARIREGVFNALRIHFNKGYGIGHNIGEAKGYKKGWEEAKDDSGAKVFYVAGAAVLITTAVIYSITQLGSGR